MTGSNSIRLKLTDRAIDSHLKNNPGTVSIWDTEAVGLRLKNGKTWHLTKKIQGKTYDRKIGDRALTPIPDARKKASALFLALDSGDDPLVARREKAAEQVRTTVTVEEALDLMLKEGQQREGTKRSYGQLLSKKSVFLSLKEKPLFSLTGEELKALHAEQSLISESQADKHSRTIRALWNWACKHYKVELVNPAKALGKDQQVAGETGWNKQKRRKTAIQRHQLEPWFACVHKLQDDDDPTVARQALALEVMVMTGLRRQECLGMQWGWISWPDLTVTIPDLYAKNGNPLELPISRRVAQILRKQEGQHSTWVFLSATKEDTPLDSTNKVQVAIQKETGFWTPPNDCRRTFSTAGPAAGVSQQLVKGLMNHLTDSEVTAGYQSHDLDTLRDSIQAIEDYIEMQAGVGGRALDHQLLKLIQGMDDEEKRKLIFEMSARQAEGRRHG